MRPGRPPARSPRPDISSWEAISTIERCDEVGYSRAPQDSRWWIPPPAATVRFCIGHADMDMDQLRHPHLISLRHWWLEQGGSRGLPSAADLSPTMLRRWLDNMVVVDLDPADQARYAYYGANLAAAFGTDMVGRSIDQLPEAQRAILAREYDTIRHGRAPVARRYTADFDGQTQTWERLLLPFFDGAGAVEKIIVAVYRLE